MKRQKLLEIAHAIIENLDTETLNHLVNENKHILEDFLTQSPLPIKFNILCFLEFKDFKNVLKTCKELYCLGVNPEHDEWWMNMSKMNIENNKIKVRCGTGTGLFWNFKQLETIQSSYGDSWFNIYYFTLWYNHIKSNTYLYNTYSTLDSPPFHANVNGLLYYGCFKMNTKKLNNHGYISDDCKVFAMSKTLSNFFGNLPGHMLSKQKIVKKIIEYGKKHDLIELIKRSANKKTRYPPVRIKLSKELIQLYEAPGIKRYSYSSPKKASDITNKEGKYPAYITATNSLKLIAHHLFPLNDYVVLNMINAEITENE